MFSINILGEEAVIKKGGVEFNCQFKKETQDFQNKWELILFKINKYYLSSEKTFFKKIFEVYELLKKSEIKIKNLKIKTERNLQYKDIKEIKIMAKEFPLYIKSSNITVERISEQQSIEERRIKETEFGIELRRSEKDIYVKLSAIKEYDIERLKGIARFITEKERVYGFFSPLDIAKKIIETTEKIKEFLPEATEIQIRYATIKKMTNPLLLIRYLSFEYNNEMFVVSENELRHTTLSSKFLATLSEILKKFEPENIDIKKVFEKIKNFNSEQPYEILQEIKKIGKTDKVAISFVDKENSAKNIKIG